LNASGVLFSSLLDFFLMSNKCFLVIFDLIPLNKIDPFASTRDCSTALKISLVISLLSIKL